MDYRLLLIKYMIHVGDCVGPTFINKTMFPPGLDSDITREEYQELIILDREATNYGE